jgi:hypothetical protein
VNTNSSNKTSTRIKRTKHKDKINQLCYLLHLSASAVPAETPLAEGQWLEEQLFVVKLRMFRVGGTRRPTVFEDRGATFSAIVNTFIKNKTVE